MRILIYILIAGGFLFFNTPTFAQAKNTVHAIAFYNLENLYDTINDPKTFDEEFTPQGRNKYSSAIYTKKLHNLAFAISQMNTPKTLANGPIIIGVAEVENKEVLIDLCAQPELRKNNYSIVHFNSPDHRGIDVGLLYNPQYFKVLNAKVYPVDLVENDVKESSRDILYVAGVLYPDTIHILVNHWPSRRGGEAATQWKRRLAASINKRLHDSICQTAPSNKIVIMGDFNDDPIDPSIKKTLQTTSSSDVSKCQLYNPWEKLFKKGFGTLAYRDSWNLFDQIIISVSWLNADAQSWKYKDVEIFNRKFLVQQFGRFKGYPHRSFTGNKWQDGYSDHFPVILYIEQKIAPAGN